MYNGTYHLQTTNPKAEIIIRQPPALDPATAYSFNRPSGAEFES